MTGAGPAPSVTTDAHQRFQAAMLAVRAGNASESRRSHSNPKLGNTTASSRPMAVSRSALADGSQ